MRLRQTAFTWAAVAAAVTAAAGCGSSSHSTVSAASLGPRLLAASSVPGYFLSRKLNWDDPFDLVGEGLFLPEMTHPSQAVKEVNSSGFQGAAGEKLSANNGMGSEVTNGVIKFDTAAHAAGFRDWMHQEDLHEPCFTACIFTPRNLAVPGIQDARAVEQVPRGGPANAPPPPGISAKEFRRQIRLGQVSVGGPPTRLLVEFTVGRYLYFAWTESMSPRDVSTAVAVIKQYSDHVRTLST